MALSRERGLARRGHSCLDAFRTRQAAAAGVTSELLSTVMQREDSPMPSAVLFLDPHEVKAPTTVDSVLVNRGDKNLTYGLAYEFERWDGEQWKDSGTDTGVFPAIALQLGSRRDRRPELRGDTGRNRLRILPRRQKHHRGRSRNRVQCGPNIPGSVSFDPDAWPPTTRRGKKTKVNTPLTWIMILWSHGNGISIGRFVEFRRRFRGRRGAAVDLRYSATRISTRFRVRRSLRDERSAPL